MQHIPVSIFGAIALLYVSAASVQAVEFTNADLSIELPEGYSAHEARMSTSVTYTFKAPLDERGRQASLQISVIDLPAWSREANGATTAAALDECLEMFLKELGSRQQGFQVYTAQSGEIAGFPSRKARWMGKSGGLYQTGVMHCAREGRTIYVVNMQDRVRHALETFTSLNESLRSVQFRREQTSAPLAQR